MGGRGPSSVPVDEPLARRGSTGLLVDGGWSLSSNALLERLKLMLRPEILSEAEPFDAMNAVHVDLAAEGLLEKAVIEGDAGSLRLLVDLTQPHLVVAAEQVAQEVGLAMAPDDLIVAMFSTLFVETAPRLPGTRHYLAWATNWMREHAEAWIRDLAMLDTPKVGAVALPAEPCPDGSTVRTPNESDRDFQAHALKVCFHRLDVDSRRVLRAFDVQDLSRSEAALQLGLSEGAVEVRLREARRRLAEGIGNIMPGPDDVSDPGVQADRAQLADLLYDMSVICTRLVPEDLEPGEVTKRPDPRDRLPIGVLAELATEVCARIPGGALYLLETPVEDPSPDQAAVVARTCLGVLEQVEGATIRRRFGEAFVAQAEADHERVISLLIPMCVEPMPEWWWLGVRWLIMAAYISSERPREAVEIGEQALRVCPTDRTLIFNTATAYSILGDDEGFDRTCAAFAASRPQCDDPEWWESFLADEIPGLAEDLGRDIEDVRARLQLSAKS
jgi:RNA polymerase sigma factor (sigma-70 family)